MTPRTPKDSQARPARVELTVERTATVLGADDKPALELAYQDGAVRVAVLPRNGAKRQPVRLADLNHALEMLGKD